jgi:hypothetical protein
VSARTQTRSQFKGRIAKSQDLAPGKRPTRQQAGEGGRRWGSAFCGWCAASGLGALLVALIAAGAVAIKLSQGGYDLLTANALTVGVGVGIGLIACLFLTYYMGGYVAGRMAHADGARQGFRVWLLGLAGATAFVATGVGFGNTYNLYQSLDLPQIPVNGLDLRIGAAAVLIGVALVTLGGAIRGGKSGERFYARRYQAG